MKINTSASVLQLDLAGEGICITARKGTLNIIHAAIIQLFSAALLVLPLNGSTSLTPKYN